jgi:hypothetical protein
MRVVESAAASLEADLTISFLARCRGVPTKWLCELEQRLDLDVLPGNSGNTGGRWLRCLTVIRQ